MFGNQSFDVVSFNSQLSVSKAEGSVNIQTTEIVYTASDVQTVVKKSVETQTDVKEQPKTEVNYDKLAVFLNRVTPSILEALDEAYGSNAFDNYDSGAYDSTTSAQLLRRIPTQEESDSPMKVSDVSWGVGGGTLAVSLSVGYHAAWCDHLSYILFYNLTKDDDFPDTPNKKLEINSCVTMLSYHPSEPSVIAAGLFNGDVLVWNLTNDDTITPIQVCNHGDIVSQIYWRPRTLSDVSNLISSSKDGYILIHKLLANFSTVSVYKRFKIIKEHNPVESSRPRSAGGSRERAAEAGLCLTTFDFSNKDPSVFVVGTLYGGLYKCNVSRAIPIEGDHTLLDPVIDEYERPEGSITCIKSSPTYNIFIASTTDKDIHIYDFDQHVSLRTIPVESTVIGFAWMIGNQNVFATCGAGSTTKFYNVGDGKAIKNVQLDIADRDSTNSIRVNPKRDMLAIGDIHGTVEVWKIPRQLF